MNKSYLFVVVMCLLIFSAIAGKPNFSYGYWDIDQDDMEFGFECYGEVGYSIPLNLNDKPDEKDLSLNYNARIPSFSIGTGLEITSTKQKNPGLKMGISLEFGYSSWENGDSISNMDLDIFSFSFALKNSARLGEHISVIDGKRTGLFYIHSDPTTLVTSTFADYTTDKSARTGNLHLFDSKELGFGYNFGKSTNIEFTLMGRFDTYYPRYLFWKELARGSVYSAIQSTSTAIAKQTDVWALSHVGTAAVIVMEMFNLNFYPEIIGVTHQHIFTPSANLTIWF